MELLTHIARATSCPLLLLLALGGTSSSGSELVSLLLSPWHANLHTDTTTTLYTAAFLPLYRPPLLPPSSSGGFPFKDDYPGPVVARLSFVPASRRWQLFPPFSLAFLFFGIVAWLPIQWWRGEVTYARSLRTYDLQVHRDLERKTRSQPSTTSYAVRMGRLVRRWLASASSASWIWPRHVSRRLHENIKLRYYLWPYVAYSFLLLSLWRGGGALKGSGEL